MKYLEAILGFLTTIARLIFRAKGKHKPGQPVVDDTGHPGCPPSEYGSGLTWYVIPGQARDDRIVTSDTFPLKEKDYASNFSKYPPVAQRISAVPIIFSGAGKVSLILRVSPRPLPAPLPYSDGGQPGWPVSSTTG